MKTKSNFINDYFEGFTSIFRAFKMASRYPSILVYFVAPFLLNLVILVTLVIVSLKFFYPFMLELVPPDDIWYWKLLRFALGPFILLFTVAADLIIYSITGSVLCAPFLDFLSEKIEKLATGKLYIAEQSFFRGFLDIVRVGTNSLFLIAFIVSLNIAIIILNVIPVLGNGLYLIINFLAVTFVLGFQFFDFPLERRKKNFSEKLSIVWSMKWKTAGLGAGFMLLSFIPLFGFLGVVAGTIAGTMLYLQSEE
jgi:CysZ protein